MGKPKKTFDLLKYLGITILIFVVGFGCEKLDAIRNEGYQMTDILTYVVWFIFSFIYFILWISEK